MSQLRVATLLALLFATVASAAEGADTTLTLNAKDTGYRGIWYMNQPLNNEYRYKYSGGLGTYCAKHQPFAVYCEKVGRTFFCYGGTPDGEMANKTLLHMVSYYDHRTGMVPRPTILLNKRTTDAHDNPVISVDDEGTIWIFSTSHGTTRPSYIHRSVRPYDVNEFVLVRPTKVENGRKIIMTNFSYMQAWHVPGQGFAAFFTRYNYPAARTACFMTSSDGIHWSPWQRLAAIDQGHYQISSVNDSKAGTALNYHPKGKGLNWRTNLYYLETTDSGQSWRAADGTPLTVPLTEPQNPALIHDYETEGLLVYLKDIRFDASGHPVILFLTSKGFEAGPKNAPRTWTTARWTGQAWTTWARSISKPTVSGASSRRRRPARSRTIPEGKSPCGAASTRAPHGTKSLNLPKTAPTTTPTPASRSTCTMTSTRSGPTATAASLRNRRSTSATGQATSIDCPV
jgi:hypothetical protein